MLSSLITSLRFIFTTRKLGVWKSEQWNVMEVLPPVSDRTWIWLSNIKGCGPSACLSFPEHTCRNFPTYLGKNFNDNRVFTNCNF